MTERKRLKAVRRRNTKVSNHNFETKTLIPVEPIIGEITQRLLDSRQRHLAINKQRRIERNEKIC